MSPLRRLSTAQLSTLAAAFESGQLTSPVDAFAVARVIGRADERLVAALEELSAKGASVALRLLAEERRAAVEMEPELVWSGPDATAQLRDTSVVVRELFRKAEREVLVAGFVVVDGRDIFRELAERMDQLPELEVRVFLNVSADRSLGSDLRLRSFVKEFAERQWPGRRLPYVYYDPRSLSDAADARASLHAKAVVIDRTHALVTSANLTPHAQQRNIELGLLVRSVTSAARIAEQFDALVEQGHVLRLPAL